MAETKKEKVVEETTKVEETKKSERPEYSIDDFAYLSSIMEERANNIEYTPDKTTAQKALVLFCKDLSNKLLSKDNVKDFRKYSATEIEVIKEALIAKIEVEDKFIKEIKQVLVKYGKEENEPCFEAYPLNVLTLCKDLLSRLEQEK